MVDSEKLEAHLAGMQRQMSDLQCDATTARVLAVAADREVSECRGTLSAHTRVLSDLSQTQSEHLKETRTFETKMSIFEARSRSAQLETTLHQADVRAQLAKLDQGMAELTALLRTVLDKLGS
ncbi:hypothetical protein AB5J62_02985 [Amycolatopsis sp. cg5]|uniref:hypothetical protein n=1 Tax=Amycolatopsis sp. cg5 TaxID=3238802 RepID=UPI003524EAF2